MAPHLEERLQKSIARIRMKVIEMGGLAVGALEASMKAYNTKDRKLAYYVILRDRYIDEMEVDLDRLCQEFLVREQPAGRHLRFVYSVIKINNELERIGDYAESIARHMLISSSSEVASEVYPSIDEIANTAIPMLKNALIAFQEQDAEMALNTGELEKRVDKLRNEKQSELFHLHEAGKLSTEAMNSLMIIVGRLERVSDQACNICEEVLFMATGETVKHPQEEMIRVLFIDQRDACRGQMAKAIGKSLKLKDFKFSSAGVAPMAIDPYTVKFLAKKGMDISSGKSKHINQILHLENYEVIVSLCREAEEAFPPAPTKTARIQWQITDPSQLSGSKEEVQHAYETVFNYLDSHITDLVHAIKGNQKSATEES